MSRINEAMRRAAEAADESRAAGTDLSLEFVTSELEPPPHPTRVEHVAPGGRALVVQPPRPLPSARDDARAANDSEDVRLTDFVHTLYRRRWVIVAVVAASVGGMAIYNSTLTPVYEARVRLHIEPRYPQVVTFLPVQADDPSRLEYYQTQMEIIRSRGLARRTLERLGLLSQDSARQPGQIGGLVGSLTVSPVTQSRLVDVRFKSTDPEYAARVVNALAEDYVEQNLAGRVRASREASEWLSERLTELRQQVDASEGALQQFRESTDAAISLEDRQNIVVQKLAQLNSAVTAARTRRIEQQALYSQLQSIQRAGAPVDTFPPIVANSYIQGLKADLAGLQRERAQLSEQLGERHPEMIRVGTAIAAAERRLQTEVEKVLEGIRNDLNAAQANERGLMAALEEQKKEVLALNRDAIGYGALQRDAASTQQIFESILQRVKEAELSGELQANNIRILDRADVPRHPVWPNTRINFIIALFGGGFVAVGLVLGLQYVRPRLVTPDEIGDSLGLPLLGIAPKVAGLKGGIAGAPADAFPPGFREAFRGIRASILLSPVSAGARTLAVTSTSAGEGKTLVSSNLAISMALAGRRVLLVDGDMRRPTVHRLFRLPRSPGFSDVLSGRVDAAAATRPSGIEGLSILPAGIHTGSASDLLETARFQELIEALGERYDLVVFDSPPVMAVADASIIANAASAVLFVVGAATTDPGAAQAAIQRLNAAQALVIGVVLNKADMNRRADYYPYYQREQEEYYEQPHLSAEADGGGQHRNA